ncbi:hypothetical protein VE01_03088 [Pseudogymnoascus verrucosus]|uniref:Uncharacterized protein n=1 Tax=Pseudogymnoascus verrucosus TaxID=342668 RepID=A0A1B8GRF6_9PEZI|nr:uncharacterized protein VE01_03088 [Pseudogymnoascus verrucosus]OBT98415.1 hypothetical protein VE01_03088 [Pseudogymnoascus verrucosus]
MAAPMVDDFMINKKPLVKRHVLKSEIRRVDFHPLEEEPEVESSDHSTMADFPQRDETGFMNDFDYDVEDRTVKQIIALGCDVSVSKKVVADTLDRIESLGYHPDQPGRTARVEVFYFVSHVMQSHSRQMLIQQASNPFKNPRYMATVVTRLLEIYLAGNPDIRFLIITYPMHHLSLMLSLRDHIGSDVFKVVTIVPAAPFAQRSSSLGEGGEDFTHGRQSPTIYDFDRTTSEPVNLFFTPDEPSESIGKPDFVLYTTSPFDTVERVPIRMDLLIQEIEEFVNPPEDPFPITGPRPAVAWTSEPTGLPHPLANITRAGIDTPLEPIDLDAAVRYQTSKLMAKYQYQRLKRYPGAPPRESEVVNAQWEHTYKKVYKAFRKIKLGKDKPDLAGASINPSDDEKADDEGDPENSEDESDDESITSIPITPIKDNTSIKSIPITPTKDDTSVTEVNEDPFQDGPEEDDASTGTVERHPIHSEEELFSAEGSSPQGSLKKKVSFSPLSMSYSFEKKSSDRSSGFWAQYAEDHL